MTRKGFTDEATCHQQLAPFFILLLFFSLSVGHFFLRDGVRIRVCVHVCIPVCARMVCICLHLNCTFTTTGYFRILFPHIVQTMNLHDSVSISRLNHIERIKTIYISSGVYI